MLCKRGKIKKCAVLLLAATNTTKSGEWEREGEGENEKSNFQRLTGVCQIRRHANFNKQQLLHQETITPLPVPLPYMPRPWLE